MADWVIRLIEQTGYVGVFLLMFLETVFPPVPSEVIMPIAGLAAARGQMALWGVILSGTAGAMFGNFFWYLLARVIGIERFRPFIERHGRWLTLDWYDVEKAEHLFGRFGGIVVGAGRMLPTIRSVVSIPAGLLRMRLKSFLLWSSLGTGHRRLRAGPAVRRDRESRRPAFDCRHYRHRRCLCLAADDLAPPPPGRLTAHGHSSARVRVPVNVEQVGRVHLRVDLRRRQARVAE